MTSKFFSNKNSFDDIQDPTNDNWGLYWYLKSTEYQPYCWNRGVFTPEEIERIKVLGRRAGIHRAETSVVGQNCLDHRRSFNSWLRPNQQTSWIYQRLTDAVNQNNEKFFNFDLSMIEYLQFTYYSSKEDGCYMAHTDPNVWKNPHNRKLSIVVQLSDPTEYEGGELRFHISHQPTPIPKQKGMLVMFPSYTLHEVTPVTKGERYSLVGWVHGPVFK